MLTLVPGISGGSETYARGLARALARRRSLDVVAFVPPLATDAGEGLPTEVVGEYRAATSTPGRLWGMARAAVAAGPIRRRFGSLDVVHYPLTVPLPRLSIPTVVTLHDVQHLDLPDFFPRSERLFRRLAYDRTARHATRVIVPSAFVRDRAVALLQLDPAAVSVVPHGLDHDTFSPGAAGPRETFLLYPARPWPHKNHEVLFEAFAVLRGEEPELRLVLTGAGTEVLDVPEGVEGRGAVPLEVLVSLYRRTACLVFPSLYEGFGSPPLEAMACGAPVAAADAGSVPEVCGDAAVLFEPTDPEAIAAAVTEARERATELSRRGLERAAAFTWDRAAGLHEDVYRQAVPPA